MDQVLLLLLLPIAHPVACGIAGLAIALWRRFRAARKGAENRNHERDRVSHGGRNARLVR
ncbi:hypothetical protein [Phyllobacterium endophyticum]|nr:hypothetical protein [Phyllobacterium endophyticum]MBB3235551.1 hypothetical protein [Phyllobacterium endophyticum]TYR41961.1 hypothetical protein FY050_11980 [Phyllobacterium endophyticum]